VILSRDEGIINGGRRERVFAIHQLWLAEVLKTAADQAVRGLSHSLNGGIDNHRLMP
jgi:hypothetical protein